MNLTFDNPLRGFTLQDSRHDSALEPNEQFSAITFNDTLEHFPDARVTIGDAVDRLCDGGLLSINIPSSRGIIFRLAVVAKRFNISGPFDRLWQAGLPSPHLWYFEHRAMERLVGVFGLVLVYRGVLESVSRKGLWQRVHLDRSASPLTLALVFITWFAAPLLNFRSNSDIMHLVFRKN